MTRMLFLIEGSGPAPDRRNSVVAFWSMPTATEGTFSIPSLVEQTGLELRRDYLAWVHHLGNIQVNGRSLKEFLLLSDPDFSAWWFNRIADKAPMNSTSIYQAFKLRALEKLYIEQACTGLTYQGRDPRLHETLKNWCGDLRHPYRHVKAAAPPAQHTIPWTHRWVRNLPHLAQAGAFLAWKLCTRYVPTWLRGQPVARQTRPGADALIVTYFPNINFKEAHQGRFRSIYWGALHNLIDELPVTPTWVWIHGNTDECNFQQALSWRDRFNAHAGTEDRHCVLEEFASLKTLVAAVRSYARIYVRGFQLRPVTDHFVLPGSTINFFPFFKREWKSSLFGTMAFDGLLYLALFDSMVQQLSPQRWCLYVWENQPWESALLAAWRHHQRGPIIGSQHATMMPLDLRGICDPQTYREEGPAAHALPDVLAVNGQGARDLLRQVRYPEARIVVVEALRYPNPRQRGSRKNGCPETLLVIGGYLEAETRMLLRVLHEAGDAIRSAGFRKILIKEHPFGPTKLLSRNITLPLTQELVSEPLETLWRNADFALISNSTSAAVEALYAEIPVAVCGPSGNVNLSPLYGHTGVPFVSSGPELTAALATARRPPLRVDYFLISEELKRWKKLLLMSSSHADGDTTSEFSA